MPVILGEGVEEIRGKAFFECTSLQRIVIPRAVKKIHDDAFKDCSNLNSIVFCNEIEEFVTADSMRTWWNRGFHERSVTTYSFLVISKSHSVWVLSSLGAGGTLFTKC